MNFDDRLKYAPLEDRGNKEIMMKAMREAMM